jgi:cellulose synthase/poly-beta-1,6-N-acetylglucosamine synthase-like glycosyltransferase/peptidoglycan hydrolase-like protein with peptidoglycan-binding domain
VRRFQRAQGLAVDGVIGRQSLAALRASSRSGVQMARSDYSDRVVARTAAAEARHGAAPRPPAEAAVPFGAVVLADLALAAVVGLAFVQPRSRVRNDDVPAPRAAALRIEEHVDGPALADEHVPASRSADATRPPGELLGELLRDVGAVTDADLAAALDEQARSGGRLGEILVAYGAVAKPTLTTALARQFRIDTVQPDDRPVALLGAREARSWRAVALARNGHSNGAIPIAVADPTPWLVEMLEGSLGSSVKPKLCDDGTLDALLNCVYADVDASEATRLLQEESPELSASGSTFSRPQLVVAGVLGAAVAVGLLVNLQATATVLAGLATLFFVTSTGFRLYAAWQGYRGGSTIDPPRKDLAAMDERTLPVYTILLPLYKEKPATVRALFAALSRMDYPKHKLDGLLLLEADDDQTADTIAEVGLPAWMRVQPLPPGTPRTKPRAMCFGLRCARGEFITVYDAEDKPDPDQLKKAVWAFQHLDPTVACVQAKLGYYNTHQNLLTRWFTLEYDAWFNVFLPGLHRMAAPIPLGGTSNHFRRPALEGCLGWDPYNVTEDADLGLRFARLGFTTGMLESTTGEEANSRVANWLRQRSRWSKGFMQTVLVHTRHPLTLLRELGPKATFVFLLTIGGAFVTALLAPIFWLLLVLWIFFQPEWIAALFPGPSYYLASLSLLAGNFALVFLSLSAAVRRGHDDLSPHALLMPCYWALMSAAAYMALVELFLRPHHWHKTEHGLHLAEEPA